MWRHDCSPWCVGRVHMHWTRWWISTYLATEWKSSSNRGGLLQINTQKNWGAKSHCLTNDQWQCQSYLQYVQYLLQNFQRVTIPVRAQHYTDSSRLVYMKSITSKTYNNFPYWYWFLRQCDTLQPGVPQVVFPHPKVFISMNQLTPQPLSGAHLTLQWTMTSCVWTLTLPTTLCTLLTTIPATVFLKKM